MCTGGLIQRTTQTRRVGVPSDQAETQDKNAVVKTLALVLSFRSLAQLSSVWMVLRPPPSS